MLCLTLAIALAGVSRLAVHAAGSTITLSASTGKPNQSITVRGQGFGASETVAFTLGSTSVGSALSKLNGSFSTSFTVPVVVPGTYTLSATGTTSHDVASASFTIPVFTTISLSPRTSYPNGYVVVQGQGFAPQETVTISFNSVVVGQAVTATNGKLATNFVVPNSTQPGSYSVTGGRI
jgi:hypothetical protein